MFCTLTLNAVPSVCPLTPSPSLHTAHTAQQEGDSFFQERLSALRELDCTPSFTKFSAEAYGLVQSLPQLVFHKQQIVDLLITHLKAQNPATVSLLE